MPVFTTVLGFASRFAMTTTTRFFTPKKVVVNIAMNPSRFVQDNLKTMDLRYHFSRRDQVIDSHHDGWRVAQGRKWLVLTEHYVDKRKELILMCKDA
jgi:hypothetical protein